MSIHPTAIVEDGARLGRGVEIGPFCIVGKDAMLGDGAQLGSHAVITGHTEIGARTQVFAHCVLGGEAQIRGGQAPEARLVIGEDCVLREMVTISAGSARGHNLTRIGDRAYFMATSHVGHDCEIGSDVTLANAVQVAGHVTIGDGVIMGGLSTIQQFGRIGRYAFIGGLSAVGEDVIPYGIAVGRRPWLDGINLIGLRRRKVPRASIHALRAAYRAIFMDDSGSLNARAEAARERWHDIAELQEVVAFILAPSKQPVATRGKGTAPANVE